jgi:plastocyanin
VPDLISIKGAAGLSLNENHSYLQVGRALLSCGHPWRVATGASPLEARTHNEERSMRQARLFLLLAALLLAGGAYAADDAIRVVLRDGKFDPAVVEVPAGKRFRLEVINESRKAIEFESKDLKQEKVIPPGKSATVTINALKAGEYKFYDEFNEATARGKVVVR